jgi:microcystin-dependent protein
LYDGMTHLLQFNAVNGLAPTLNVNVLGAKPLHYYAAGDWRAIPTGLIGANQIARVAYNSGAGAYRLIDLQNKTGEVASYAGATAPAGALFCFGQAVSRTDYVGLFTAISTTYGTGDGSTTFNLPDMRGRVAGGLDNMGGSAAGRLTSASMGPNGTTLGATGGSQISLSMDAPSTLTSVAAGTDGTVAANNHAHNNTIVVQPTILLNAIIKT